MKANKEDPKDLNALLTKLGKYSEKLGEFDLKFFLDFNFDEIRR